VADASPPRLDPVPPGDRAETTRSPGWSRPFFTAALRGSDPNAPLERWEEVLRHEGSIGYRAVRLLARVPLLRRLGRVPPEAVAPPATLAEREAVVARVRATPLYRLLEALRASGLYRRLWLRRGPPVAATATPAPAPAEPPPPPTVGPLTSRRIDAALDVLRTVPFEALQRRGWHFQPNHFYWPLNDVDFLAANAELWHGRGLPKGIDWDLDAQLALAAEMDGYRHELADVPREPRPGHTEFVWENNAFGGADAVVYYGMVRSLQPRRVVEVGAGWSSLLLARALARNAQPCAVTLVEPEPNPELFAVLPADWSVRRCILQHADLALFDDLQAGDVCLFDGSHCVRTASDVTWFFFEVLPRLASGVVVQIHDMLFPEEYLDRWVYDEGLSWNEQYLVQAFLMHNDAYHMRIANHMLWVERRADIDRLHGADGSSIVLEKL
jgi:predicted O-methyltransferase YrrM